MEILCRLCAVAKEPDEIRHNINDATNDIERKLISCCDWNSFRCHVDLPQSICYSCYLLLEQSWNFQNTVSRAQKKLYRKVLGSKFPEPAVASTSDKTILNAMSSVVVKVEENIEFTAIEEHQSGDTLPDCNEHHNNASMEIEQNELDDDGRDDASNDRYSDYGDDDRDFSEDDNEITIEDIKPEDGESSKNERKTRSKQPIQPKASQRKPIARISIDAFDITKFVDHKDINADGTINEEIIRTQKFIKWEAITTSCSKCKNFADDHTKLKKHFTDAHPEDRLEFYCPYCENSDRFWTGRYWRFHIVREHFEHLAHW